MYWLELEIVWWVVFLRQFLVVVVGDGFLEVGCWLGSVGYGGWFDGWRWAVAVLLG